MHRECTFLLFLFSFCLVVSSQPTIFDACHNNELDVVEDLILGVDDLNIKNSDEDHLIFIACKYSELAIIRTLVNAGALLNVCNKKKFTPLMFACLYQPLKVVRYIVKCNDIDINACNCDGNTALVLACDRFRDNFDLEIIKYLLDHGVDINHESHQFNRSLRLAYLSRRNDLINLLSDII